MPLGTWESNKINCLAEDFGTSRLVSNRFFCSVYSHLLFDLSIFPDQRSLKISLKMIVWPNTFQNVSLPNMKQENLSKTNRSSFSLLKLDYTPSATVKYAIGLADKQYKGIWEWESEWSKQVLQSKRYSDTQHFCNFLSIQIRTNLQLFFNIGQLIAQRQQQRRIVPTCLLGKLKAKLDFGEQWHVQRQQQAFMLFVKNQIKNLEPVYQTQVSYMLPMV